MLPRLITTQKSIHIFFFEQFLTLLPILLFTTQSQTNLNPAIVCLIILQLCLIVFRNTERVIKFEGHKLRISLFRKMLQSARLQMLRFLLVFLLIGVTVAHLLKLKRKVFIVLLLQFLIREL
jgi:hypothetical protein